MALLAQAPSIHYIIITRAGPPTAQPPTSYPNHPHLNNHTRVSHVPPTTLRFTPHPHPYPYHPCPPKPLLTPTPPPTTPSHPPASFRPPFRLNRPTSPSLHHFFRPHSSTLPTTPYIHTQIRTRIRTRILTRVHISPSTHPHPHPLSLRKPP